MSAPATPFTEFPDALPVGTILGDFTVTRVIGLGGFGIVYMAHDNVLQRTVAIKEYLPITIAGRTSAKTVLVRSTHQTDTYLAGLHSFMREARLQARFSHPAMLEVYQVWEHNGTAYMAMRYYPGEALLDLRQGAEAGILFDEAAIRRIMAPVFDGLQMLHAQNVLHRDVSPDNILIMPSGAAVLLDFGSARMVVVGAEQSLTTVLKPGYAPVEQYIDDGTMEQGPWTDVYALGAVLYFLAMGTAPPQAVSRMLGGTLHEFEASARGRYSAAFISAVTASLTVQPTLRVQSVAALRDALGWPDEPAADTGKSVLVSTMALPFNAEWRAAQRASPTPSMRTSTPAASDAVTVLVTTPMACIAPAPRPALAAEPPGTVRNGTDELMLDGDDAEGSASPLANDSKAKSGNASAIRRHGLLAACVAIGGLGLAMIVQPEHRASTTTPSSAAANAAESPPKLRLTATLPDAENKSLAMPFAAQSLPAPNALPAGSTKHAPSLARPRATVPKKSADEVKVNDGVAAAAPATSAATTGSIAPAADSRPAPIRLKSAACQRQQSRLAPSEAANAQSENGQLSDCR